MSEIRQNLDLRKILGVTNVCIFLKSRFVYTEVFPNFLIAVIAGGLEEWISDGSCDDINNNALCQFDG